ncbi:hypothetical protein L3Q82_018184 [Scortum barcoo]|uniref:Uncharacterized protein n=1 Tax=Scortum barcoo TaxID=214431 RepID=A0ACB8VI30_9TELE|nr:hypothetical protein L3Q82_018184 [Scortum barcoo]
MQSRTEPQTHIWKLCSPAMAQPTARHEGDQGGEERTAVSQTPCQAAASAQPRSMPAPLARPGADHRKDAEEMTGDGGDPRRRSEQREQRTDVSTPAPYFCPPTPHVHAKSNPSLRNSPDSKVRFRRPPPPSSSSSSTHLQTVAAECPRADGEAELTVYPTPKSVAAPADPPGCQILCSAAVCWCGGARAQLQAGTPVQLLVDLDALIITHTSSPSQHGKEVEF